ncbi:hypothetical protein [Sinorhizobium meliloti]|uniref:hypothetical protein n=1 Tax=Rhizobium meliloti TaxID=382 RepID=UPI000FDA3C37|nr:hypothetical protein [Sinorhizobium meliloti]RVG71834.1 hypothetical protein CN220_12670 [Sinorhizobium meliloti]RVH51048.1 hypothetical protein CN212_09310 [Sinorhizobium meliloti]RVO65157.1 hypothetical protein CN087_21750 [Sinorhizobium meliloti]
MSVKQRHVAAARIVQDAGGELVGRTRLQKVAFLMHLAGFDNSFSFEYRHYGPYSEDLSQAMDIAVLLGPVDEVERVADWGGRYSIYSLAGQVPGVDQDLDRANFVQQAKRIDAVELELAATAAYLFEVEGIGKVFPGNPWEETARRKPTKVVGGRLAKAAAAYEELRKVKAIKPLPELPAPSSAM